MSWYKRSITAEKVQREDKQFSWIFIDASKEIMNVHSSVSKDIDEKDLYKEEAEKEGDWIYGIEDSPHITVKFGLEYDDPQPVIDSLKGEKGGNVEVIGTEIFENDDKDVLVVRVKSEALDRIHDKLTDDLGIEDNYPEYKPHITIGYFKKGKANKYESMVHKAFTYYLLDFDFDEVFFEDRDGKPTTIKLV